MASAAVRRATITSAHGVGYCFQFTRGAENYFEFLRGAANTRAPTAQRTYVSTTQPQAEGPAVCLAFPRVHRLSDSAEATDNAVFHGVPVLLFATLCVQGLSIWAPSCDTCLRTLAELICSIMFALIQRCFRLLNLNLQSPIQRMVYRFGLYENKQMYIYTLSLSCLFMWLNVCFDI